MMKLARSKEAVGPAVPKVAMVAVAQDYPASDGSTIHAHEVDLLARTKALLNASAAASPDSLEVQLLAEERAFVDCAAHPDFAEGLAAFFEKRRAAYARS